MRIIVDQVPVGGREGDMERVAVVFPAYNEERHVGEAVRTALEAGVGHVVCVNDCSVDFTGAIIDNLASDSRVAALHHEVNQGKQAAVKHGLALALARAGTSAFAVLDSDMQLDPGLLPGLCHHIGPYDLVIGRRRRDAMPAASRASNTLANTPYRLVAGVRINDVQSGYRIHNREVAECLAEGLAERGGYVLEHITMLLFGELAARRNRDFRIAEIEVPCLYGEARSDISLKDYLQLTWATIYHAAALARLLR